jgi:hypothetical protein
MPAIEHEGHSYFETLAVGTYLDGSATYRALLA